MQMRRQRTIRRTVGALIALLALLAVAAIGGRLWLRHAIAAGAPQMDGTLRLPSLTAPVTIRRDALGIPHVQASNEDDLLRAQGYVTAQDRLWQMDMLRRHAAGELAEVLGSSMLDHDKTQRYLQLRAVADRSLDDLPPAERHALNAYAEGVNAAIAAADPLPAEFRLLGYTPRPWTARDSLLVGFAMAQDLSTSYPNKLNREAVQAHLTPEQTADLYPTSTFRDHPPAEGRKDLSAPREMIEIPLDPSQSRLRAPELRTPAHLRDLQNANEILSASVSALRCDGCAAGSNNWAVSAARSASGKPLVANDMHLNISVPGIWYTADLHAPGLDAAGVTLPGVPYIVVGHNAHVAWGFTNSGADVQDLYIEQRSGDQFRDTTGAMQPLEHHRETIHVKHGLDTTVDVALTRHGDTLTPILTPLFPHETRTLALRWSLYEPHFASVPFGAANHAATGAELEAAFASFGGPSQNLVWGDDSGHIGYHLIGMVPLRTGVKQNASAALAPNISQLTTENSRPQITDLDRIGPDGNPTVTPQASTVIPPTVAADTNEPFAAAEPKPATFTQNALATTPVPAGTAEWTGLIPFNQLPAITDPPSGVLATANARITPDTYPYPIALDWESPYRNERIWRSIGDRTGLTPADMTALQNDVYSALDQTVGQRVAYAVDHSKSPSKKAKQAADLLRGWDGRVTLEAPQPNITQAVRTALLSLVLEPRLGKNGLALYTAHSRAYALEMLIEHADARWLPQGYADWNALLTAALEKGLHDASAPGKLRDWQWGRQHTITLQHPVFGKTWYLRWLSGSTAQTAALPGNAQTVRAAVGTHSASERMVVDLDVPDRATMTLPMGESGTLGAPHFADQFTAWATGRPLPITEVSTSHRLTLTP